MDDIKKLREVYKNIRHVDPIIKAQLPGCNRKSELYLDDYGHQLEKSIVKKNKEIEALKAELQQFMIENADQLQVIKDKIASGIA